MTGAIDPSFINPVYSGASLADDMTSTNNNLFGSGADPTTANPAQSQAIIDAVNQAVNGGSATGTSASQVGANLSLIPAQNVQPSMSNSTTVTVDAAGPGASSTPNSTAEEFLSWLHPLGASANYLAVAVHVAPTASGVVPTVALSNTPMAHLGSSAVGPTGGRVNLYGLMNPATGSQLVQVTVPANSPATAFIAGESISYNGVYRVGEAIWSSGTGSNPSMSVGSITGQCVAQTFAAYNDNAQSVAMSSYNQTQEGNTGNVVNSTTGFDYSLLMGSAPGAGSVSFSATVATTNAFTWWAGVSVNLLPSPFNEVGSGMRLYANSGTALPVQTTMGPFPNYYLQNVQYMTADMTQTFTQSVSNTVQVAYAGWYMATVSVMQLSGAYWTGVGLYHNGSLFEQGSTQVNASGNTGVVKSTFLVYCNANDTLEPAYLASHASAAGSESTGTQTYWSCALVNRSYL